MEEHGDGTRRATGPLLSVAVLLTGLIATALSTAALYQAQRGIAGRAMDERHRTVLAAVRAEIERFSGLLDSVAAGIATDDELTWEDFDVLTEPLTAARPAGAAPVAFVVAAPTADVAAAERLWRGRGATGVSLRPNPGNGEHYLTVLSRPLDEESGQHPRTGADLAGAEPVATALELARDTHRTTVSDAYVPARDRDRPAAGQRWVAFASPVWTRANVPEFRGWVVSGLHGGTFLQDILRTAARSGVSADLIAVDTDGTRKALAAPARPGGDPGLRRTGRLEIADRHWILETRGDLRHLAGAGWYPPIIAPAGGLILTGLLAWLVHVPATGRAGARAERPPPGCARPRRGAAGRPGGPARSRPATATASARPRRYGGTRDDR
ncbi:CHASE domain-containing protein [Actinoplanes sp. NPDC049802]|uniref:CHASE domain-containing protein n=1 Tax=Actinoplanes sp. NPDC049802 TaxID=3154742 RepID=UPI0033D89946